MPPAGPSPALAFSRICVVPSVRPDGAPANIIALTRGLAVGDDAAFREFHGCYFNRLYHFLLVVTHGDEHAAKEAVQETMLRVARHARAFQSEEVFWCWLKAIGRNAARDGSRKRSRYMAALQRLALHWTSFCGENSADDDRRMRALIEEGLSELATDDRQLIEGKYLRGATVAELAEPSGRTEKAVESRLGRLRHQLADTILKKLRRP